MNILLYQQYLEEYVKEAIAGSSGDNADIAARLWTQKIGGLLVKQKEEKNRALEDARKAFDEHRHWPLEIILSHLGLDAKKIMTK